MSYPNYPKNRLIVDNVDLTEKFKMILADGYTLEPPKPKTYTIEIPGGNGTLDLTETLTGDTTYENRHDKFQFYALFHEDFEKTKTDVSNFLHGKAYDYKITMDKEYTYHGRFTVSSYLRNSYSDGIVGIIEIAVEAAPFKLKKEQVFKIDAVGGAVIYLDSGRMRVRPTVETDRLVKIIYMGQTVIIQQGSWTVNDLLLTEGVNEVYLSSYDIRNIKWSDFKTNSLTWGKLKERRLFEWYKSNGNGTYLQKTWANFADTKWSDITSQIWGDQTYLGAITENIKDVYIKYAWGDL